MKPQKLLNFSYFFKSTLEALEWWLFQPEKKHQGMYWFHTTSAKITCGLQNYIQGSSKTLVGGGSGEEGGVE